MLTGNVNPLNQWPKVRRVKPGVLRVKGRCISTGQWMVCRFIGVVVVSLLIISCLTSAVLPWLVGLDGYLSDTNPISLWIGMLTDFRWWLRELLTQTYPAVGETIYYTGTNPFDWHLLGVWIALIWLRKILRYCVAAGLATIIKPILGRRFKVTFTRNTVKVHRWLRSLTLHRHASSGGEVAFRCLGPEYQTGILRVLMRMGLIKPNHENEVSQVAAVTGLRPVKIVGPRRQLDSEKIVQSMQLAMQHSRNMME